MLFSWNRHANKSPVISRLPYYTIVIILLITSTIWCGTYRAGLQFKCVLTDNLPSPGEVSHTTGVYIPSFLTVVLVLLRPTRTR